MATEIGDEAVTQKKKSSVLPKPDIEGREVQKIGQKFFGNYLTRSDSDSEAVRK